MTDEHIGSEVLIIRTLPPIQGTVIDTRWSRGRLWLTVADDSDERYEETLGDVIFL